MSNSKDHSGSNIIDKDGVPIHAGDQVYTKFRGDKREGQVEALYDKSGEVIEGSAKGVHINVKNPPKVVFHDQHGHQVAHNPQTLTHPDKEIS
ncbi:hypothetical protein FIBSPDRAFT_859646 [Athelia psychrophila]|uniref:Hypervirulence associated protein TUDOR domain-containing protein n=1 Tax=Athelia psychrophila TaxID=1759441 RepID=A0A166KX28_9AGAM|nr:hypothetical protein FIBSPDRAFT_859646 [Fibularhizoctonia sp. CBS 109695]